MAVVSKRTSSSSVYGTEYGPHTGNRSADSNNSALASGKFVPRDMYPPPLYEPNTFVFSSQNRPKPGFVVFENYRSPQQQSQYEAARDPTSNRTFVIAKMKYELSNDRSHLIDVTSGKALVNYSDWGSLEVTQLEAQRLVGSLIRLLQRRGIAIADIVALGMKSEDEKEKEAAGETETGGGKQQKKKKQDLVAKGKSSGGKVGEAGRKKEGAVSGKKVKKTPQQLQGPAVKKAKLAKADSGGKRKEGAAVAEEVDEEEEEEEGEEPEEEECTLVLSASSDGDDETEDGAKTRAPSPAGQTQSISYY